MRVLCYTNKLNHGGAERVMSIIANELHALGHYVVLINDYKYEDEYSLNPLVKHYYIDGYYGDRSGNKVTRTLRRVLYLRKKCREHNIDVVVSFISDANYRAILATIGIRTKNVISVRNDPYKDYAGRFKKKLGELFYSRAEGCVFQTEYARDFFSEKIISHSCVIENPISDVFFDIDNCPLQEKKIVACGRLTEQKRFDILIDVFSKVHKRHPDYTLEIYGDGELKESLYRQIAKLNLNESIFLKGRSNSIQTDIGNASVFVLSSDFEGMPNALLEAMALGLPCVSTDCDGGGPRAIINNEIDGILVSKHNEEEMVSAISSIIDDKQFALKLSKYAREKGKKYSPASVVKKWEKFLQSLQ